MPQHPNGTDADFEEVAREIDNGQINRGLWERIFSETDGDLAKTRARYIAQRVAQLRDGTASSPHRSDDKALSDNQNKMATLVSPTRSGLSNKFLVQPKFKTIPFFYNGVAATSVVDEFGNEKHCYINARGELLVAPMFSQLESFPCNGVAIAAVGTGWRKDAFDKKQFGIIDSVGHFIIEPKYSFAKRVAGKIYLYHEGRLPAEVFSIKEKTITAASKSDRLDAEFGEGSLLPWEFSEYESKGFWDRAKINKYGYRDRKWNWAIKPQFDFGEYHRADRAIVGRGPENSRKYWFIDELGHATSKNTFDDIMPEPSNKFYDASSFRVAAIGHVGNRRWFHVNRNGERLYKHSFLSTDDFLNDTTITGAQSLDTLRWGAIDQSGIFLFPPTYDRCWSLTNQLVGLEIDGKYGIFDRSGKMLISPLFDNVVYVGDGIVAASVSSESTQDANERRKSERWGLLHISTITI